MKLPFSKLQTPALLLLRHPWSCAHSEWYLMSSFNHHARKQRRIYPWANWARAQGPPKILRFRGPRAKFRKASEFQVPLHTYLATMSIKIHANRVLGTIHVKQNCLGVFKGAQIKSGPKAPTDLNAALLGRRSCAPSQCRVLSSVNVWIF